MDWSSIKTCIDEKGKNKCVGDKATYYLTIESKAVYVEKYDADCIYRILKLKGRIGDCFFRIRDNEGTKQEKLILVEAKGRQHDFFEQLKASLELFRASDFEGNIHGRFIGTKVPGAFSGDAKFKAGVQKLVKDFQSFKGSVRFGNRLIKESVLDFDTSELVLNDSKNSKKETLTL